jgi:hypothetical protein
MSNFIYVDPFTQAQTVEIIAKHGLSNGELETKFSDEGENEMTQYLTGEGTNYYDTSGISDFIIMMLGVVISIMIYYVYEKIFIYLKTH